jgi:hypothetical protein
MSLLGIELVGKKTIVFQRRCGIVPREGWKRLGQQQRQVIVGLIVGESTHMMCVWMDGWMDGWMDKWLFCFASAFLTRVEKDPQENLFCQTTTDTGRNIR